MSSVVRVEREMRRLSRWVWRWAIWDCISDFSAVSFWRVALWLCAFTVSISIAREVCFWSSSPRG